MLKERTDESVHLLLPLAEETHNQRIMLSASHSALKYLKAQTGDSRERRKIISQVCGFVERLKGNIDEGALLNLRQELDNLFINEQ